MAGLTDWQEICSEFENELLEITDKNGRRMRILEHLKKVDSLNNRVPEFGEGLEWMNTDKPLKLSEELKGGVVVLDFFTYCCINCLHILPDLEALEHEFPVEKGVAVIGVHSAKFANEKLSANILSAVLRYNITHPVVNDGEALLWNQLMIQCWPTLTIVSPSGSLLYSFVGEGHREKLLEFVSVVHEYYSSQGEITLNSLPIKLIRDNLPLSPLSFPGKVCVSDDGRTVVISDTGHHRVLVLGSDGVVKHIVGGEKSGFKDGGFSETRFNSPQGISIIGNELFVADTENHAIRKINLVERTVETVAGTGQMGLDKQGGQLGKLQPINSPWDLVVGCSIDSSEEDLLFIAMAGSHQIWGLFLKDGKWTKGRKYQCSVCVRLAGSGNEENRNNSYPDKASFAQPSGVALSKTGQLPLLFVADAESSSVRTLSLKDGAVKALVGGERDPMNLFAYGDADGRGHEARLQHPLGVSVLCEDPLTLLVADSYNHKIKKVDVATKECVSYVGSGSAGNKLSSVFDDVKFNEPGGLCVDRQNNLVYVADTNNHSVKIINTTTNTVTEFLIIFPSQGISETDGGFRRLTSKSKTPEELASVNILPGGELLVKVQVKWPPGVHLTDGAPSMWQIWMEDDSTSPDFPHVVKRGEFIDRDEALPDISITIPDSVNHSVNVFVESVIYYCDDGGLCKMRAQIYKQTVCVKSQSPETSQQKIVITLD